MTYVQYMDYDLAGELHHALGDRGIVILDGRNNIATMYEDAKKYNGFHRPEYPACQIWSGATFTRSNSISPIFSLMEET